MRIQYISEAAGGRRGRERERLTESERQRKPQTSRGSGMQRFPGEGGERRQPGWVGPSAPPPLPRRFGPHGVGEGNWIGGSSLAAGPARISWKGRVGGTDMRSGGLGRPQTRSRRETESQRGRAPATKRQGALEAGSRKPVKAHLLLRSPPSTRRAHASWTRHIAERPLCARVSLTAGRYPRPIPSSSCHL